MGADGGEGGSRECGGAGNLWQRKEGGERG